MTPTYCTCEMQGRNVGWMNHAIGCPARRPPSNEEIRARGEFNEQPVPEGEAREADDPRLECWFCPGVQSVALAPRHSGGDMDVPAHWVPVCERHCEQWHNETDAEEMLPIIPRYGVALSKEQATLAGELLASIPDVELGDFVAYDDLTGAIQTGLRHLHDIADPNEPTGDLP